MKSIQVILFDIGNVILFFNNHRVSKKIKEITGQSEDNLFKTIFGLYIEKEIDVGKTPVKEFLQLVKKKLNLKLSLEKLEYIFSDIFTENKNISHLIQNLKGKIPLLAITNTNESHLKFIRRKFPILHLLDRVIASY